MDVPLSLTELEHAVMHFKIGKTPGVDGLTAVLPDILEGIVTNVF